MKSVFFLFISLTCFMFGCASGTVFIDTLPPSGDVYLKSKTTEDYQLVGKAPYKISLAEFKEKFQVEGPFGVEARMVGYTNQSVLVTELPRNTDINIFLNLKASTSGSGAGDQNQGIVSNETLDQLFESMRLVKVGRYDDALNQLNLLQQKNPSLSAIFEMQGGVFYMKKDFPKALDSYEKAARLNPNNLEVYNMKKYLEKFVDKKEK